MIDKTYDNDAYIIYACSSLKELGDCILQNGGVINQSLPFIDALCVSLPGNKFHTLQKSRITALLTPDAKVSKLESIKIGTNPYREDAYYRLSQGLIERKLCLSRRYRGNGVGIAIVDTGIAPHYDLLKPQNRIAFFKDFVNGREQAYDDDGHGTHVAGIAAGNGYCCPSDALLKNGPCSAEIACDAHIIALKALDSQGEGDMSGILAALQWIYYNHNKYNIKVVNLSLGMLQNKNMAVDPMELGVKMLTEEGITVIAACGNSGPAYKTISSPASSPHAIAVGCCHNGEVSTFSSRGPVERSFATPGILEKPDLVTDGVNVFSLSSNSPKAYVTETGTSMATPIVSGAAACLYSMLPQATPGKIRSILMSACTPLKKEDRNSQGHGLLTIDINQ